MMCSDGNSEKLVILRVMQIFIKIIAIMTILLVSLFVSHGLIEDAKLDIKIDERNSIEETFGDDVLICRNCQYKLSGQTKYCPNCGHNKEAVFTNEEVFILSIIFAIMVGIFVGLLV